MVGQLLESMTTPNMR